MLARCKICTVPIEYSKRQETPLMPVASHSRGIAEPSESCIILTGSELSCSHCLNPKKLGALTEDLDSHMTVFVHRIAAL